MPSDFDGARPPRVARRLLIKTVTTAESREFVGVSRKPYGYWFHWWGARSHECTKETGKCHGCEKGWPSRFRFIAHVMTSPEGEEHFLEFTVDCWEKLVAKMTAFDTWRGVRFRLWKTKGGPKGRYCCEVFEQRIFEHALPEPQDPINVLRACWEAATNKAGRGV